MDDRRAKLERLREQGIDPFPHEFDGRDPIADVHAAHDGLEDGEETDAAYRIAGRMTARRGHGGAAFIDLVDRSGKLQVHAKRDVLGEESLRAPDLARPGRPDRRGRHRLQVPAGRAVSLQGDGLDAARQVAAAPPEKFHGLEDVETRYRHRELDLIANEEIRELFILRSKVVRAIRRWLDERGFLEVETPILQPLYGGALARPFTTHHNALDRDFFLRIADELYLKRLIVGGLERVYEIGKDFRNEGISHKHNPEFTMLEWYEAYADYVDIAARLEELIAYVAKEVGYDGPIDFSAPWRRLTLREAIREETGVDIATDELPGEGTWAKRVDDLLSKRVEPDLHDPTFILDYPKELSPFAKDHRSEPGLVERFECFAGGMEFANAFTELNDPDEQRARFEQQRARRGSRRRRDPALRRGLRAGARARHAADRRHRHRHRPPRDAPERPRARSARSCSSRRCAPEPAGRRGARVPSFSTQVPFPRTPIKGRLVGNAKRLTRKDGSWAHRSARAHPR